MIYCIADASYPLEYVSWGNLISEDGVIHPKRNIDSFVLILVVEGTLHIAQGNNNYDVKGNEFILLLSNTLHYGYKPSKGFLSYHWVHFYIKDPNYVLYTRGSLLVFEVMNESFQSGSFYTGQSLLNYLNQTRISVAKNLLTSRDLSIYFIASTCGFRDEKYFMKLFKKYERMTPTQYRKAFHQKKINTN